MTGETKGITQFVAIAGRPLGNWQIYPLPMATLPGTYTQLPPRSDTVAIPQHCGFLYGNTCGTIACPQPTPPSHQPQATTSINQNPGSKIENSPNSQMPAHISLCGAAPLSPSSPPPAPAFFRAHFTLTAPGDTFLDTAHLGKGVVWINGHNLGRFWSVGPQRTLYVPGPWLRKGVNEIVVFDMLPNPHESVTGLDHPILDQPVSDKTVADQQ